LDPTRSIYDVANFTQNIEEINMNEFDRWPLCFETSYRLLVGAFNSERESKKHRETGKDTYCNVKNWNSNQRVQLAKMCYFEKASI